MRLTAAAKVANATLIAGLAIVHFSFIVSTAVNVPDRDEWEALQPGALDRSLNLGWLLAFHNEHRIVWTKLQTWLLYRLGGWNEVTQIVWNFGAYLLIWIVFSRLAKEQLGRGLDFIPALGLSTIIYTNHIDGFQGCFHFFILFFVTSIYLLLRGHRWGWLGVVCAVFSAYALSAGVICAAASAFFCTYLAWSRRSTRWHHVAQAITILALTSLWCIGFQKNPGHPPLTGPWSRSFWDFYLNALSLGFGFKEQRVLPGAIIAVLLGVLIALTCKRAMSESAKRDALVGVLTIGGAFLLVLGSVTVARTGFGLWMSKEPRYAEIGLMLLPVTWLLVKETFAGPGPWGRVVTLIVACLLAAPFLDKFQFHGAYFSDARLLRLEGRKCIQRYLSNRGDGNCPTIYPANLASRIDRARALHLSLLSDMETAP